MAHHQKRSMLVGSAAALAGTAGLVVAYFFLGMVTGVIAMCSWAPDWWADAYFPLAFILPALGVWFGVRMRRRYLHAREG